MAGDDQAPDAMDLQTCDRYFTEWHAELHPFTDQCLCCCPTCAMGEGMWPGSGRRFQTICPDDPADEPSYEPDPAGVPSG